MNTNSADRVLEDWLSQGPNQGPEQGLRRALAATRSIEQRPGWSFPSWWLPRTVSGAAPQARRYATIALAILLLLLAVFAFASGIGRQPPPRILQLLGPAAQRLVAFSDGNAINASRLDGSALRTLSGSVTGAHSPVFSGDGKIIAFAGLASGASGERLFIATADGAGEAVEISTGIDVVSSPVPQFSWAPDSSRIAFAGNDQGISRIYVAAIDGSAAIPITDRSAHRDLPSWSPDGKWIAYRVTDPDGIHRALEIARPDGSDPTLVTQVIAADGRLSRPRWSPNANKGYAYQPETAASNLNGPIAYWLNAGFGTTDNALIWLGVGHTNPLWTQGLGGSADAGVAWSPDGNWLAMITATEGVVLAHDVGSDTEVFQTRVLGPVADCWVDWLPDGSGLYGGSPDGCTGTVVIPLSDPGAALTIPGATGIGAWQPLEP